MNEKANIEDSVKSDTIKKNLLENLELTLGVVTQAIKNTKGVSRTTFYDWTNKKSDRYDKEFHIAVLDIENVALDFVESQLFQKIQGTKMAVKDKNGEEHIVFKKEPDTTAVIFYLKTKGKSRGYVERQEHDHTTKGDSINEPRQLVFRKKQRPDSSEGTD